MSHNDLVRTAQEKKCYEAAPHLCIAAGIWAVFLMASRGERREPLRVFPLQKKKEKKDSFKAMHTRFSFLWNWKRSHSNIC